MVAPVRVLIIDDAESFRMMARRALVHQGWTVDEAATADAGLEAARRITVDVILLDFVLPDADGLVLLDTLRQWGIHAPVIALSGSASPELATRFLRAGAVEFVNKDQASPARLVHAVKKALATTPPIVDGPLGAMKRPPRGPDDGEHEGSLDVDGARVLLVDDTEDSRFLVRRILAPHGWEVEEAATAADALWRAQLREPDVIILDHVLPDMEGVQLLWELRRRGVRSPVVALTGHGNEKVAEAFLRAGAADFLSKDELSEARLLQTMRDALAMRAVVSP